MSYLETQCFCHFPHFCVKYFDAVIKRHDTIVAKANTYNHKKYINESIKTNYKKVDEIILNITKDRTENLHSRLRPNKVAEFQFSQHKAN